MEGEGGPEGREEEGGKERFHQKSTKSNRWSSWRSGRLNIQPELGKQNCQSSSKLQYPIKNSAIQTRTRTLKHLIKLVILMNYHATYDYPFWDCLGRLTDRWRFFLLISSTYYIYEFTNLWISEYVFRFQGGSSTLSFNAKKVLKDEYSNWINAYAFGSYRITIETFLLTTWPEVVFLFRTIQHTPNENVDLSCLYIGALTLGVPQRGW